MKFRTQEEAQEAMEKMTGYRIANKILMCKPSNSFVFTAPSPNLYIKPLPSSFTEGTTTHTHSHFTLITPTTIRTCTTPSITHNRCHQQHFNTQHYVRYYSKIASSSKTHIFLSCQYYFFVFVTPPPFTSHSSRSPLFSAPHLSLDTLRDTFDKFGLIESVKIVRDQNKPDDVVGLVRYL